MLKLARRARGHFVTLIEIRVHLIRVKPGHISRSQDFSKGGSHSVKQSVLAFLQPVYCRLFE